MLYILIFFFNFIQLVSTCIYLQEEITYMIHCQVISIDVRGHGETQAKDPEDMSSETLVRYQFIVKRYKVVLLETLTSKSPKIIAC